MKNLYSAYTKFKKASVAYKGAVGLLHSELEPFVEFEFFLNDFPDDGIFIMNSEEDWVPVGMPVFKALSVIKKDGKLTSDNFEPIG